MASLHRHKTSPYWYCSFRAPDGSWKLRSTKEAKRGKAQDICSAWEKVAKDARRGKLTEHAARRVINDIYAMTHEESLPSATAKEYFDNWITKKEVETAAGTARKYKDVTTQFLAFLGDAQQQDVARVSSKQVAGFRDHLLKRVSSGSVNIATKILRVAFAQAKREGYVTENPAENVALVKRKEERIERRPFTLSELKQIVKAANDEWRGMILFGLYTGQRLKDIAQLTWKNIDLDRKELRLVTGKTGRRQILPLAAPLVEFITDMSANDNPGEPLFPKAHQNVTRTDRSGHLSNQFYEILCAAGLAKERTHVGEGKGRGSRRTTNEVSFHSLRHTATSLLKNAGVSNAVAQEFIGHDSAAVSANYTHIDTETLRKAADTLPDVLK